MPIIWTQGEAKHHVCNAGKSGVKAWEQWTSHFDPRLGTKYLAARQKHHANVGTRSGTI